MRMLSGTAVHVDNAPNEMQVDLSPCQHLSLLLQSLVQRQPNSVLANWLLYMQPLSLSPFIYVSPAPSWILTGHLYFCASL